MSDVPPGQGGSKQRRPEPGAELDERLRAAFRHGARGGTTDAEALLERVRRGGRRRRTRRTVGVVAVAATSLAVAAAAVTSLTPLGDPADDPADVAAAQDGPAGTSELAVYDVQTSADAVWALASGDCGRSQLCAVLARSTDNGASWDLGRPRTTSGSAALNELRHLAVSDGGQYVLAAGRGVATSRDAGATWQPVELARGRQVQGAAAGATESVVVFDEPGTGALATARTDSDEWVSADAPIGARERLVEPFAGGDLVGAAVLSGRVGQATGLVLRGTGADWARVATPCSTRTPLVATDGTTVWYLCHDAAGSVVATSTDVAAAEGAATWTRTGLPAARNAGLGAWDDGTAVVATDQRVFSIDSAGRAEELTGSDSGLGLPPDDYTYRATADGWLASFRGVLLHRTGGGESWIEVPVP